mmetsp:Transcript_19087/g.48258  ORF Transcript_19087/g.48258 Transcript_19087/m.48258 type:complete len:219 (-) Transcript_19087:138-794(-)
MARVEPSSITPDRLVLDDVLNDCTMSQLKGAFYEFLTNESAEEALEFLEAAQTFERQALRDEANDTSINARSLLGIEELVARSWSNQDLTTKYSKAIIDRYIIPGAPREINIEEHTRQSILNAADEIDSKQFEPAVVEIKRMLDGDAFTRFQFELLNFNIGEDNAFGRMIIAGLLCMVMVIIFLLITLFGYTSRVYRVFLEVPLFVAAMYYSSSKYRI